MTTNRDFDRLARAWLDLMPDEAPDRLIANVRLAVDATPQQRRWGRLAFRRPFQMNRITLIAATAAVALALVGGAILLVGNNTPTTPTAAPTAAPTARPTAVATPPTTPVGLRSWWVANAPTGSTAKVVSMEIQPNLVTVRDAGSESVIARAIAGTGGEFAIAAPDSNHGCQQGDAGRYSFAFARPANEADAGDLQLDLTATADACAARKAILERTWTRVFTNGFRGGRAVAIDFDPMFMITLPAGAYDVTVAGKDALMVESPTGNAPGIFVATRNPAGFSDPCSVTGGDKVPLAHTIDAFATYMDSLPGFTVQRSDVTIGGLPAVHLTVPTTITPDCPDRNHQVIEWSTSDPTFRNHWVLGQGEVTDSMYLVEVGTDLYLFQWLRPTVDERAEMSVLSTITFIDTIPS